MKVLFFGEAIRPGQDNCRTIMLLDSMKLINHFLPIAKLQFDANDLQVPEVKKIPKVSWFKALREWLFGK